MGECPLWVKSRQTIAGQNPPLSALVQKRTFRAATYSAALSAASSANRLTNSLRGVRWNASPAGR